jgi:lipid-binding SYLF domain-containing protein
MPNLEWRFSMKTHSLLLTLAALLSGPIATLTAAPRDRSEVGNVIEVLDELAMTPEKCVPPALLRDANAVIIAPNMLKGGFVIAARHGLGVMLVHEKDGSWSNPVFVKITGASLGFQVGVQATDLFLVVRNRRSLDRLMRGEGKLTLGADASVAAGPLGRQASADTDAVMRAEILSYSRSRGVFAGVALEGDSLRIDAEANERFYGKRDVKVADIVDGKVPAPEAAAILRLKLAKWPEKVEVKPATLELPRLP